MSGRGLAILGRFPAHLEAARPGKRVGTVVEAMASLLDLLSVDLAAVRRSHRIGHADTLRDVLLIAGLHGLTTTDLALRFQRSERLRATAAALESALAATPAAREAAADALLDLFGVVSPPDGSRLALFAPPHAQGVDPDLAAGAASLLAEARAQLQFSARVDTARDAVLDIVRIHATGNGTVRALLEGTATALDLVVDVGRNAAVKAALRGTDAAAALNLDLADEFFHSKDLFWHSTYVHDRVRLAAGGVPVPTSDDIVGIEENPLRREEYKKEACEHGHRFSVLRRGFGRELLQIRVTGRGNKTVGPMVVNRDEGKGVGFFGSVPDGQTLTFTEEGRVFLEGADVTAFAFSFEGACFADSGHDPRDFVFDGAGADPKRRARFAVAAPDGALDRDAVFPRSGESINAPGVGIGETRIAFFIQEGHLSSRIGPDAAPAIARVTPHFAIAFADHSVFAPVDGATRPQVADVLLSWLEHEGYALRLIIPARFALLDADPDATLARVAAAVNRYRPAGVQVRVEYEDDRWTLGAGALLDSLNDNPNLRLQGMTALWPSPED